LRNASDILKSALRTGVAVTLLGSAGAAWAQLAPDRDLVEDGEPAAQSAAQPADEAERDAPPADPGDDPFAKPIISDEEFDDTIPPIDEDIDAPMGSIAEWDAEQQRLEAQARQEDAEDGVAGLAAAQDGDANELLADPPGDFRCFDPARLDSLGGIVARECRLELAHVLGHHGVDRCQRELALGLLSLGKFVRGDRLPWRRSLVRGWLRRP